MKYILIITAILAFLMVVIGYVTNIANIVTGAVSDIELVVSIIGIFLIPVGVITGWAL